MSSSKITSCLYTFIFLVIVFMPYHNVKCEVIHDKFIVLTPPKCGTHLLTKVIELIVKKRTHQKSSPVNNAYEMYKAMQVVENKNMFFSNHHVTFEILRMLKKKNYKIITILRDPRDQLISRINWCLEGKWPPIPIGNLSKEEQINAFICGDKFGFQAFEQAFDSVFKWFLIESLSPSLLYVAHFENLVGPRGGGTVESQILEITNIASHIGVVITPQEAYDIASKAFGNSPTFRKGQIGVWKTQFTELNKKNYKIHYGEILIDWGYEKNYEW